MRSATEVFGEWAEQDRDDGMALRHAPAVRQMVQHAMQVIGDRRFTHVDAGCGNGWVVRMVRAIDTCIGSTGVDGAAAMIEKARSIDPDGDYQIGDLMDWSPDEPVDLVTSMEVIYYLPSVDEFFRRLSTDWLAPGGVFIMGIDFFSEHEQSHQWPDRVGTPMTLLDASQWKQKLQDAGLIVQEPWHAESTGYEPGTLLLMGQAPSGGS